DVDQEADARDDEHHDRGDRVEPERDVGVERADRDPAVDGVVQDRRFAVESVEPRDGEQRHDECAADRSGPDDGGRAGRALADRRVPEEPEGGQQHDPAQERFGGHHRSVVTSSAFTVARVRKSWRMMASPTAASAAATAITKKTITWPSTVSCARANVTNVRFTAFSMSSIDMKTTIRLRRTRTPTTPSAESTADSTRY